MATTRMQWAAIGCAILGLTALMTIAEPKSQRELAAFITVTDRPEQIPSTLIAQAEPDPAVRVLTSVAERMSRQDESVRGVDALVEAQQAAQLLVERWRLDVHYAQRVATAVFSVAETYALDPLLLMAVAATESSFRHQVGNPGGGADPFKPYGIMQVAGRWHPEKFPEGQVRRTTVEENIEIGAKVLAEYLGWENGNVRRALLRYNGSLGISTHYFDKVAHYRKQFQMALTARTPTS